MIQIFAKMELVEDKTGKEFRYFFNPSNSEFKSLLKSVQKSVRKFLGSDDMVRGLLIDGSGDLIIFDPTKWTHTDLYRAAVNSSCIPLWLGDGVVEVRADFVSTYSSRFDPYVKGGEDRLYKYLAKSLRIREALGSDFRIDFMNSGEEDDEDF